MQRVEIFTAKHTGGFYADEEHVHVNIKSLSAGDFTAMRELQQVLRKILDEKNEQCAASDLPECSKEIQSCFFFTVTCGDQRRAIILNAGCCGHRQCNKAINKRFEDFIKSFADETKEADAATRIVPKHSSCFHCMNIFRKVKWCSRCQARPYCSVECQKADWEDGHKKECKQLSKTE